jgi:hypothetical protein
MSNQPFVPDPRYSQADEPTLSDAASYAARQENVSAGEPVDNRGANRYVQDPPADHVNPLGSPVPSYQDRNVRRANERYWVTAVISFVLSILEIVMALRFVFRLLAANQYNGFVAALYSFSYIFVAPFSDIFTNPALGRESVLEVSTLIAMLIYALVAWALIALARIVFAPALTSRP